MEFKITSKAKLLTVILMVVGVVFTGIGVALEFGHDHGHHMGQRVMANMLVNSFFFFGIDRFTFSI